MDPFVIAEQQLRSGHDPAAVLRQLLASHGALPHQGGPPMMGAAGPPGALGAGGHPGLPNGAPTGPPPPMGGPPPGLLR